MSLRRLLVVDDDPNVASFVEGALRKNNVQIFSARSGEEALERLHRAAPDAILLDIRLPGMNGLETFAALKQQGFDVPVVIVTSHASMETTVEAMKEGAYDFLTKPLRLAPFEALMERLGRERLSRGAETLADVSHDQRDRRLIGKSPAMIEVYKAIGRVARTDATVLITGESGTGKELVARVIHQSSQRRKDSFLAVNCAAIPEHLLESELFGHEKGAFTGSIERKVGKFERAHRGTVFLDEIGDMALPLQGKILRALEEGVIERVGGTDPVPVDVRVLAATNQRLLEAVEQGGFRKDLYYRLAVVTIDLPPLRERKGDVRLLIDFFVAPLASELNRRIERIDRRLYDLLERHDWPGNVRELRNVLKRLLIVGTGPVLSLEDLPSLAIAESRDQPGLLDTLRGLYRRGTSLRDLERLYLQIALEEANWSQTRAAEILRVHRNTVRRKMAEYGLGDGIEESRE